MRRRYERLFRAPAVPAESVFAVDLTVGFDARRPFCYPKEILNFETVTEDI